ncbi:MAG: GntR family transcriptional regulator [Chloroflexota bacterium]
MIRPLDHQSALPLYAQAETALREMIQRPEYQNGALLPRETDLARRLGISRHTMRVAMDALVRAGLLTRKKGVGTQVNTTPIQTRLTEWTSFSREMDRLGVPFETLDRRSWREEARAEVARYLGIQPGTAVIALERLKGQQGQPVVLFRSWFHPRLGIPESETFDGPLYQIIESRYHAIPVHSEEWIGALGVENPDRERLGIDRSIPILYRRRLVTDASGKAIEFGLAHYRADRFEYAIRITRDGFPDAETARPA